MLSTINPSQRLSLVILALPNLWRTHKSWPRPPSVHLYFIFLFPKVYHEKKRKPGIDGWCSIIYRLKSAICWLLTQQKRRPRPGIPRRAMRGRSAASRTRCALLATIPLKVQTKKNSWQRSRKRRFCSISMLTIAPSWCTASSPCCNGRSRKDRRSRD